MAGPDSGPDRRDPLTGHQTDTMRAMILAAGRGERMRPLSDETPKPMLLVGGKPLLQYQLENLSAAGITDVVINTGRLGRQIEAYFGDGRTWGVSIVYSREGETPLDTGGGIRHALPLLGAGPFLVVNGDIWIACDFQRLPQHLGTDLAHLVMVANPPHHPQGDFLLEQGRLAADGDGPRLTYAGVGVFAPELFRDCREEAFPLVVLLRAAMRQGRIRGEFFAGDWLDVGTPERLQELDSKIKKRV
jgi:MurNAc alpha-1-phosphate uridylyltransferase